MNTDDILVQEVIEERGMHSQFGSVDAVWVRGLNEPTQGDSRLTIRRPTPPVHIIIPQQMQCQQSPSSGSITGLGSFKRVVVVFISAMLLIMLVVPRIV